MTTSNNNDSGNKQLFRAEVDVILRELQTQLQGLNLQKKQFILKAAVRMSEVMPKEIIAKELIQGLKALNFRIDRSYIYRILGEQWPHIYGGDLSNSRQIDENKDIEESANAVREAYDIDEKEEPKKLDFYRNQYLHGQTIIDDTGLLQEIAYAIKDLPDVLVISHEKGRATAVSTKLPKGVSK